MMMCTKCKKRPAVVFVSNPADANSTQGLCLVCAREMGIKPVNDIMAKMGITSDDDVEAISDEMNNFMSAMEGTDMGSLFQPGGAVSMPNPNNMALSNNQPMPHMTFPNRLL